MGRHKEANGHLPPRMLLRHGAYYWTPRVDGRQVWQHLGSDYPGALKAYYEREGVPDGDRKIWRLPEPKVDKRNWKTRLFCQAKANAKSRGVEFSITLEELTQLAALADGRCQVTRIPFEVRFADGERRRQWAPSLDRMDPRKGYTFDNCRLVCVAVNIAMNDWGIDVLLKIGRALKEQRLI
jgi:hypothetical protein